MKKNRWLFGGLVMMFILEGCVPVAFVAGAAAGTVIYDQRSTKTIVEDRELVFRIRNNWKSDQDLTRQNHISATSFNRIVLLVGQVTSEEQRNQAENLAKSAAPNIRMLYNEITVEPPIANLARSNDTWITTKVKTVLAATSGLNSSSLKILTENGVVYLMGLTTRTQATLAADKTRTVTGVKKVVKLFEYVS